MNRVDTDILILGAGGAGLFAALHAKKADPDLDDLHPESLWKFRIRGFGPLLVTMDSHGGSLHADVNAAALSRRDAVLAKLGAAGPARA